MKPVILYPLKEREVAHPMAVVAALSSLSPHLKKRLYEDAEAYEMLCRHEGGGYTSVFDGRSLVVLE